MTAGKPHSRACPWPYRPKPRSLRLQAKPAALCLAVHFCLVSQWHRSLSRLKLRHSAGFPLHVGTLYHELLPVSSSGIAIPTSQSPSEAASRKWNPERVVIHSLKEFRKEKGARPEGLQSLYDVELEVQARQMPQQQKVTRAATTQPPSKSAGSPGGPGSNQPRPDAAPRAATNCKTPKSSARASPMFTM